MLTALNYAITHIFSRLLVVICACPMSGVVVGLWSKSFLVLTAVLYNGPLPFLSSVLLNRNKCFKRLQLFWFFDVLISKKTLIFIQIVCMWTASVNCHEYFLWCHLLLRKPSIFHWPFWLRIIYINHKFKIPCCRMPLPRSFYGGEAFRSTDDK